MCVCVWLAMGGGMIKGRILTCSIYVGAIQPVNAAHLDCGAYWSPCGNNVLKLAESFPDRNHINCTMITGLQITNYSGKNANT